AHAPPGGHDAKPQVGLPGDEIGVLASAAVLPGRLAPGRLVLGRRAVTDHAVHMPSQPLAKVLSMAHSPAVTKAVIPVAGMGTRFLPATKATPKEMLPVVDTPTIHYVVDEAVTAGISDVLLVTGRGKRAIEDYFDRNTELEDALKAKG